MALLCYAHPDYQAIGICKSCHKGLCPECAAELDKGLACRGHCEEDVRFINQELEASRKSYDVARSSSSATALFYFVMGAIILLLGILTTIKSPIGIAVIVFGGSFIGMGFQSRRTSRRWPKF